MVRDATSVSSVRILWHTDMIFVTLGTQAKDFSRLLKMVEELAKVHNIGEIIAQVGYTKYHPQGMTVYSFIPSEQYEQFVGKADVIITHAGTGAIFSALKRQKKVIAVARLKRNGEMIDDHQTEIVKKLSSEGYILDGTNSIISCWEQLNTFTPQPFDLVCTLPQAIGKQIDEWLKQ